MIIFIGNPEESMKKLVIIFVATVSFFACKQKKKSLVGDEPVTVSDFIEFFPEASLPYRMADTSLAKPGVEALLISNKIFTSIIPDSVLAKDFGKSGKPKIYALGRVKEPNKENYLFFKAIQGSKRVGYMATFSKEEKFMAAMPLVRTGFDKFTTVYGLLDNKFQITTYKEKIEHGQPHFKRNVYLYNSAAGQFTLIMTEPNEEIIENVVDPLDTLPRKNKFSGNYVMDSRNFISVRDAKNSNEYQFFIHFEKDNGNCIGELKGMLRMVSKTMGQYQEPGNPCALEITFSGTTLSMKETGGCGSYRDIKCFFEGRYPKKALPKPRDSRSVRK